MINALWIPLDIFDGEEFLPAARKAGLSKGTLVLHWIATLIVASWNGRAAGTEYSFAVAVAHLVGEPVGLVERSLSTFRRLGFIRADRIVEWERYAPQRETFADSGPNFRVQADFPAAGGR